MDTIWDRKFFEVGGHWPLWRGWKQRMTTQNRQKSNAKLFYIFEWSCHLMFVFCHNKPVDLTEKCVEHNLLRIGQWNYRVYVPLLQVSVYNTVTRQNYFKSLCITRQHYFKSVCTTRKHYFKSLWITREHCFKSVCTTRQHYFKSVCITREH